MNAKERMSIPDKREILTCFSFWIVCQSGTVSEMRLAPGSDILSYQCKVRNVPIVLWESSASLSWSRFGNPLGDPPIPSVSAHRLLSVIRIPSLGVSE